VVAIKPIPAGDSSSFIIHDNSSEIAKIIPEKYVEPLVIIARVQGFDGIDDNIIHLIKDELEMFADTRNDLDDSFQKYMHDMIIGEDMPNEWTRSSMRHRRDHSSKITTKAAEESKEEETGDDDDGTTEEATTEDTNENEGDDSK
jgi:hypothetical protein